MDLHYCKECLKLYDEYDSFRKLSKCIICKKYYCEKCIKKTKQKMMNIHMFSFCNDCYNANKNTD